MQHKLPGPLAFLLFLSLLAPAQAAPPAQDLLTIQVTGRKWLWEFDHGGGVRTIGTLRVPAGRKVQLLFTSRDIAHRFSLKDLKIQVDVDPGKQRSVVIAAARPGQYRAQCMRYCGAGHPHMIADVLVLPGDEYERWLAAQRGADVATGPSLGKELFSRYGCTGCHGPGLTGAPVGPSLTGLYGTTRRMTSGALVRVDDAYLRESILQPVAKVVAGYQPVMPAFQGVIGERHVDALVLYLRSLRPQNKISKRSR